VAVSGEGGSVEEVGFISNGVVVDPTLAEGGVVIDADEDTRVVEEEGGVAIDADEDTWVVEEEWDDVGIDDIEAKGNPLGATAGPGPKGPPNGKDMRTREI
jgi:hypothetical protein